MTPGLYSLWMVPDPEEWTVLLHPNPALFHSERPAVEEAGVSFAVRPEIAEMHMEPLTFYFSGFGPEGATLAARPWCRWRSRPGSTSEWPG